MGNLEITIAEQIAKYVKILGKRSVLETKPISNINLSGIKYSLNVGMDICELKNIDRSLCPQFLDSLKSVSGTTIEKVTTIKDKMLKAMGYKEPELLNVDYFSSTADSDMADMGINYFFAKIFLFSKKSRNFSNEMLIAMTRHELDHVDKMAKLVKAVGIEKVEEALPYTIDNKDVWIKLSKDANIEGFDSEKYLKALKEYICPDAVAKNNLWHAVKIQNKYCTNLHEESAYKIQKKVYEHFNIKEPTLYDVYGEPITKIETKLRELCEAKPEGFYGINSFEQLYLGGIILKDKNGLEALKAMDEQKLLEIYNKSDVKEKQVLELYKNIYSWLDQGIYNVEDLSRYFAK